MLPRLLYVGDVRVEASYHGSTLLYRLFQGYPAARLHIAEGNLLPTSTARRLPDVRHTTFAVGRRRLLNTRFHDWYSRWLSARAASRAGRVRAVLDDFSPEAIVTVGHGYSWVTAARLARELGVPLHFIIHDDWPRVVSAPLRRTIDRVFGDVYRQASSRLCASPFMVDDYLQRYGAAGTVLLPCRAVDAPTFTGVAERLDRTTGKLVYAFAGTINSPGYASLLRELAATIAKHDGQLLIFGPISHDEAAAAGLALPNVTLGGLLPADQLLMRLRREADVLFVPMSFALEDAANMRMGFPSKLTEYTAVGLPLLICGPPGCSAVRWATDNAGVAEVATSAEQLPAAVARLSNDAARRITLATTAQQVGARDFSAATAQAILHHALQTAAA